jgi:hypothetical protein
MQPVEYNLNTVIKINSIEPSLIRGSIVLYNIPSECSGYTLRYLKVEETKLPVVLGNEKGIVKQVLYNYNGNIDAVYY